MPTPCPTGRPSPRCPSTTRRRCSPTSGPRQCCTSRPRASSGSPSSAPRSTGTPTSAARWLCSRRCAPPTARGGSLHMREAMRAADCRRIVFSSTAATYGEPDVVPIREDAPTRPTNTYGASKLAVDHMLTSYAVAHGFAAVSLRYFNVAGAAYGLGERHATETHLVPLALQVAARQRDSLTIYGKDYPTPDGTCIRDYVHVGDLADAHLLALPAPAAGEHRFYNLGNGRGFSVQEVVDAVREVTRHELPVVVGDRRPGDPAQLVASSERIQADLGWTPEHTELPGIVRDAWDVARTRA